MFAHDAPQFVGISRTLADDDSPSVERPVIEAEYLRRTRAGYDVTAAAYVAQFHGHLNDKPLDLAMLSGFAGLVRRNGAETLPTSAVAPARRPRCSPSLGSTSSVSTCRRT